MLYFVTYSFFNLISLLPLPFLYVLSDLFAFFLYYIIQYRRKVVRENLQNAFPDKTLSQIISIEKSFYKFLCRTIVETIKLMSISEKELKKRCTYTPQFHQIFEDYYAQKKDILVLMGHLGNWEWAGSSFNLYFKNHLYVLYHPLSNKVFDKLMKKIRTRFGTKLIPMHTAYKHILSLQQQSSNVFTFIADQCPSPQNAFWMNFLNQDTPVYYAPEIIAKKLQLPVIFVWMKEIKKGYYQIDAKIIQENISEKSAKQNDENYPVMRNFMQLLEEQIIQQPEIWLWSHKRWKHKRKIN